MFLHTCLLGVSFLQAQLKELQIAKAENQKLSDFVTVKDKEITELKQSSLELQNRIPVLRQEVQGQIHFTCLANAFNCNYIYTVSRKKCTVFSTYLCQTLTYFYNFWHESF